MSNTIAARNRWIELSSASWICRTITGIFVRTKMVSSPSIGRACRRNSIPLIPMSWSKPGKVYNNISHTGGCSASGILIWTYLTQTTKSWHERKHNTKCKPNVNVITCFWYCFDAFNDRRWYVQHRHLRLLRLPSIPNGAVDCQKKTNWSISFWWAQNGNLLRSLRPQLELRMTVGVTLSNSPPPFSEYSNWDSEFSHEL